MGTHTRSEQEKSRQNRQASTSKHSGKSKKHGQSKNLGRSKSVGQSKSVGKSKKADKATHHSQSISFEDNRLLACLLGEFDSNLAIIEDRLDIEAVVHGNVISLTGTPTQCEMASEVLEHLYLRIVRGDDLTPGDIDGTIRHALSAQGPAMSDKATKNKAAKGTKKKDKNAQQISENGQAQIRTRKKHITARTPRQSSYIHAMENSDLVFGYGPAGTGKTYLAVVAAASALERGAVERIILSRPAVEAGERLGFLPGDMREKVDPYLRPLYDALYDCLSPERVEKELEAGTIEIAPLAFMRGRTLASSFVILDEAQNCTSMQMKMFLTRLGENSKMVITGDPSQIDLPPGQKSGLAEAIHLLRDVDEIKSVEFFSEDVVRRRLVGKIVEAYENQS